MATATGGVAPATRSPTWPWSTGICTSTTAAAVIVVVDVVVVDVVVEDIGAAVEVEACCEQISHARLRIVSKVNTLKKRLTEHEIRRHNLKETHLFLVLYGDLI